MILRQLFDRETCTYTYLIGDEASRQAVLIDPVLRQIERDIKLIQELDFTLSYVLDTHVHADHITGAGTLRESLGAQSVASKHAGTTCTDVGVDDGDIINVGQLVMEVLATPGHTKGCVSYVLRDQAMVFTGDALFVRGTGRTDFQQGDSRLLYQSITKKIFTLPDHFLVYPGHDYRGHLVSTVGEEKAFNPRVAGKKENEFVEIMRSLNLPKPRHLEEAVPANLQCGVLVQEANSLAFQHMVERSTEGIPEIAASTFPTLKEKAITIDVRRADESSGDLPSFPQAECVPLDVLASQASKWEREQPRILVCRSGRRSREAARMLEQLGFKQVASLRGGMVALRQLGIA